MNSISSVVKRSGAIVPFNPERITNAIYRAAVAVGGRDRETARVLTLQVVKTLEENTAPDQIPTVEEIQDIVEKVLIENGHASVAKAYILYREERARQRRERARRASRPSENIPWAKIWQVLDWAMMNDLNTIEKYNQRIKQGELAEIVAISEAAYNEDVENAGEMIAERISDLKIVIVTGPSSSGKTTTTIKLGERLLRMGYSLATLNVDNYFFDLDLHPKDEFGDYDFETPQALDLPLINQHIKQLIAGEQVRIPYYDFKTSRRFDDRTPMKMRDDEILLVDSLHALYPDMMAGIPMEQQFRLYLEPLLQMKDADGQYVRWTDIRMMRRMLRDAAHRAYNPEKTLLHWHYVRASELRNIIPYINNTDYIINSAMPYELSIYRPKLLEEFNSWVLKYQDDPLREDAFQRAARVRKVLSAVEPLSDDRVVPDNSVLREFIGGSSYKY